MWPTGPEDIEKKGKGITEVLEKDDDDDDTQSTHGRVQVK